MNIEKIDKLIELLRGQPAERLDMTCWMGLADCGTVACIAGWAVLMEHGPGQGALIAASGKHVKREARSILGISDTTASELFLGVSLNGSWTPEVVVDLDRVKRRHAIRVLEILRETGRVDWRGAMS